MEKINFAELYDRLREVDESVMIFDRYGNKISYNGDVLQPESENEKNASVTVRMTGVVTQLASFLKNGLSTIQEMRDLDNIGIPKEYVSRGMRFDSFIVYPIEDTLFKSNYFVVEINEKDVELPSQRYFRYLDEQLDALEQSEGKEKDITSFRCENTIEPMFTIINGDNIHQLNVMTNYRNHIEDFARELWGEDIGENWTKPVVLHLEDADIYIPQDRILPIEIIPRKEEDNKIREIIEENMSS